MKAVRSLLSAAALVALGTTVATAQTVSVNVAISAVVSASLSASSPNALNFGTVVQGEGATVIDPSQTAAGRVNVAGATNQGITITMTTLPTVLTNGVATLGVSAYKYCYTQSTALQSTCTATAIAQGGSVTGQTLSSSGQGFLYMGATLAAPSASQTTGSYSGNMTITVTSP